MNRGILSALPFRVQGPRGQLQAPSRTPRLGLAVGLGSTQPGGIIAALDAGMNWAWDKSLFDLAFRGRARKVPPAESRCIEPGTAMEGRGCGRAGVKPEGSR
jgi:hypothetical protein